MRDPERLNEFYDTLKKIHKENYPDWRVGQFFSNLQSFAGDDLFFVEDDKMMQLIKDFAKDI